MLQVKISLFSFNKPIFDLTGHSILYSPRHIVNTTGCEVSAQTE